MKFLKIILLCFYSFMANGQEMSVFRNDIIDYTKLIDSTSKHYAESIVEGPIIYKKLFRKNGGWEAYFLHDNNKPLRIKYSKNEYDSFETFDVYYKNGKIEYGKYTIEFTRLKNSKPEINEFYFDNGTLKCRIFTEILNMSLDDFMKKENEIKNYFVKN